MNIDITFRGLPPREWVKEDIREHAAKLELSCRHITSCRAVVGVPHQHHEEGNRFTLEIEISVPGERIVVSRDSNVHGLIKDLGAKKGAKAFEVEGMRKHLRLVIREAFDVARRQLRDYARRHRMAVKKHEGAPLRRARQARQG
jgi:ribosome-associated translation inhibitor RaiA